MANTFLISDTHFGHANICKFTNSDGSKVRPWDNVTEMDETMVENWNKAVGPKDKVYHLGDVVINRKYLHILHRLNGDKVLIKGNHDIFKVEEYLQFFRDIRGYHVLNGMILSHVPVHPMNLERFGCNVHGHMHGKRVMLQGRVDPNYFSVCVESIGYTPIDLETIQKKIIAQGGIIGFKNGNFTKSEN